jgi:hypothetical protein
MAVLETIPRRDREYVFGFGRGGYSGWSKSKVELDGLVKLKEPWTLHDLRRTVRTGLGKLGVQPHVAEAALNHLPPLDLWASHLMVAVARATGANVTALRKS